MDARQVILGRSALILMEKNTAFAPGWTIELIKGFYPVEEQIKRFETHHNTLWTRPSARKN
jgi:hypothetical protein